MWSCRLPQLDFADVMLGVVPASVADSAPPREQLEQRLTALAVEAAAVLVDGIAVDQVEGAEWYTARCCTRRRWCVDHLF